MPKLPNLLAMAFSAALAIAIPSANAAETVIMTTGSVGMPGISFSFDKTAKPPVILLRTMLAGVAGSKISVRVDSAKQASFIHFLKEGECALKRASGANA